MDIDREDLTAVRRLRNYYARHFGGSDEQFLLWVEGMLNVLAGREFDQAADERKMSNVEPR